MQTVFSVNKRNMKDVSFVSLFVLCVVLSMIFCVIYKSELLLQTDVLSQEALSLVKTYGSNKGSLFLYVLNERIWVIPLLFLLSTTYLAKPAVYGTVVWYAASVGSLWSVALLRYGMKGIWFLLFSGFPQYFVYVPALVIALKLCSDMRIPDKRFLVQFFVLEGVMLIGSFVETFINTLFLHKIIKLFIGV